jgi:hypothetical protein
MGGTEPLTRGSFNHIVGKMLLKKRKVRWTGIILPFQICYFEHVTSLMFINFWRRYTICAANRIPHVSNIYSSPSVEMELNSVR